MAGHKDNSERIYENKLKGDPRSLVFSRLADSYRKRGDIQQAVDVCSLGLKNHPGSTTGRVILGRCYLEQEKFKEAIREFTQVIESDHRNQMALKMLADIYARQGLKEKAGDLYAYLRAMDPENRSIVSLCANFIGTGRTTIHEILGLALSGSPSLSETETDREVRQDILDDIDKTIPLRVTTEEILPQQDAGPFAQTMQFDAEELNAAPANREFQVEEVISDIAQSAGNQVTGDDISSRMSMMFEEEEKTASDDGIQEPGESVKNEAETIDGEALTSFEMPDGQDLSMGPGPEISGGDISSRIEQLFGEQPASAVFDSTAENSGRPGDSVELQSGAVDTAPDVAREKLTHDGPVATDISGEDVVNRMSQLFEAPPDELEPDKTQGPASIGEGAFDKTSRFDAASQSSGIAEDARSDASSPISEEGAPLIEGDAVSGDDVAARLETIFDDLPAGEAPEQGPVGPDPDDIDQSIASGLVDDDVLPREDEDVVVELEIDKSDASGVPDKEPADEDTALVEEERRISLEDSPPDTEENFDVALTGEESPEMSGDDLVNRLTEIFPEKSLREETLSVIESVPDDEKEDEAVYAGFYTTSGENARTAQSEGTLLEKLDDVEIEVPAGSFAEGGKTLAQETAAGLRRDTPDENETFSSAQDDDDRLYSIPDHVLTPTLADIYFQQGQPNLAVQIYSRLLERDPDNDKIARRLDEIKKCISDGRVPVPPADAASAEAVQKSGPTPSRRPHKAKPGLKPLQGVRIKKDMKNKFKENK